MNAAQIYEGFSRFERSTRMNSLRLLFNVMVVMLVFTLSSHASIGKTDDERDRLSQERTFRKQVLVARGHSSHPAFIG